MPAAACDRDGGDHRFNPFLSKWAKPAGSIYGSEGDDASSPQYAVQAAAEPEPAAYVPTDAAPAPAQGEGLAAEAPVTR